MTTSLSDDSPDVVVCSDRDDIFIEATIGADNKKKVSISVLGCCGGCYVTNVVSEDDLMEAICKSKRNRK